MQKLFVVAAALLFGSSAAFGNIIATGGQECTVGGVTITSSGAPPTLPAPPVPPGVGNGWCREVLPSGGAAAAYSVASGSFTSANSIQGNASVMAFAQPGFCPTMNCPNDPAHAGGMAELQFWFGALGPTRMGAVKYFEGCAFSPTDETSPPPGFYTTLPCSSSIMTIPIQLSSLMLIDIAAFGRAEGTAYFTGAVNPRVSISASFFEADGVTPVVLADAAATPEPGTFYLPGIAIIMLIGRGLVAGRSTRSQCRS